MNREIYTWGGGDARAEKTTGRWMRRRHIRGASTGLQVGVSGVVD